MLGFYLVNAFLYAERKIRLREPDFAEDKNIIDTQPEQENAAETKYFHYKVQKDFVIEDIKMAKRRRRGALYIFLLILLFIASLYPLYKHLTDFTGMSVFAKTEYMNAFARAESDGDAKPDGKKEVNGIGDKEKGEVSYKIFNDNLSFTEARDACKLMGGELLAIENEDEYKKILGLMDGSSAKFFWFGIYKNKDNNIVSLNGEAPTFFPWKKADPVADKIMLGDRDYLIFFKGEDGEWAYNFIANDPTAFAPEIFKGKIAYICKFTPEDNK